MQSSCVTPRRHSRRFEGQPGCFATGRGRHRCRPAAAFSTVPSAQRMSRSSKQSQVLVYQDVLCPWSWLAELRLSPLQRELGDVLRFVPASLSAASDGVAAEHRGDRPCGARPRGGGAGAGGAAAPRGPVDVGRSAAVEHRAARGARGRAAAGRGCPARAPDAAPPGGARAGAQCHPSRRRLRARRPRRAADEPLLRRLRLVPDAAADPRGVPARTRSRRPPRADAGHRQPLDDLRCSARRPSTAICSWPAWASSSGPALRRSSDWSTEPSRLDASRS